MDRQKDVWIDRYRYTYIVGRKTAYIGLPYKILFIAMSHGQKGLKTAILDHFFWLERGEDSLF